MLFILLKQIEASCEVFPGNYSPGFPNLVDSLDRLKLKQIEASCKVFQGNYSLGFPNLVVDLLEQRKKKIKWPTSLTCSINLSETPRLGRLYLTSGWIVISLIFQGKVKLHKKLLTLINAQKKRFF